jgi:large subunit ribosomal protein L3
MTEQTEKAAAEAGESKKTPAGFRSILGEKVGMTQVYHPRDKALMDVTVVKAGPCPVLRVKTADGKDGYNAVQLGYGTRKEKNIPAAVLGQLKKAGAAAAKYVKEIRVADPKGFEVGQVVLVDSIFKTGDYVDVQAVSKGKGFAGVMKRPGFRGMPASHGASDKQRSPGSLASRRALGRVLPGQRMAGRMGGETVTMQKLEVVLVDAEKSLIYVNGSVAGPRGGAVTVSETVKSKKFRKEPPKPSVKKDKMGNIIGGKKPTAAAKK